MDQTLYFRSFMYPVRKLRTQGSSKKQRKFNGLESG